jgi:fatty acid amide hydrolase 2
VSLARRIRERQTTPSEVVEAHIARIEAVNGDLNAVVATRFSAAREEARLATAAVERGDALPPLHGVPCTIKEFLSVQGMPHTAGIVARRGMVSTQDALVVQRLRKAGAIILGVTNAPEGGLWHETNNPVYGRTSNPWDLNRTPGGSSGGEAAIVAAGGSAFGIGSDTGGSIRTPSAFCGIVGHKPSGGRIPTTGHFPPSPLPDRPMLSVGPMTRRVEDAALITQILSGPDGEDPHGRAFGWEDPAAIDWASVRVVPLPTTGGARIRPEVRAGVHKAVSALANRGAQVHEVDIPEFRQAFDIWAAMLSQAPITLEELVSEGAHVRAFPELLRYPFGRSKHAGGVLTMLFLERLWERFPERQRRLASLAASLERRLDEVLGPRGVMIHPPYARTAPRHRGMGLMNPWAVGCATLFNVTCSPVTVVPVDVGPTGLPIAVQVASTRGNDALTLGAAGVLEEDFGGWIRPVEPRRGPPLPVPMRWISP